MSRIVLDSSALLAHMGAEPGAGAVEAALGDAIMSAVNLAEVISKLVEWDTSMVLVREAVSRYGLDIVPFDTALAERTGQLRQRTKAKGLSLGDRACLALAGHLRVPVLTADRMWKSLGLEIDIRLIR